DLSPPCVSFRCRWPLRLLRGHAVFNLYSLRIEPLRKLRQVQMHTPLGGHLSAEHRLLPKTRRISRHRGSLFSLRRTPRLSCVAGGAGLATTSSVGGPTGCSIVQASVVAVRI